MAVFAQLERDTMIERTRAGLAAAAANSCPGGRPRKVDDSAAARAREPKGKSISASDIGKMLGVSRATVYRYLLYVLRLGAGRDVIPDLPMSVCTGLGVGVASVRFIGSAAVSHGRAAWRDALDVVPSDARASRDLLL